MQTYRNIIESRAATGDDHWIRTFGTAFLYGRNDKVDNLGYLSSL